MKILLDCWAQRVAFNGSNFNWNLVTSDISSVSILGSFNIFITDLTVDGMHGCCVFGWYELIWQVEGVDTKGGLEAVQKDPSKWKERTSRKSMELNRGTHKLLHLRQATPHNHTGWLETAWLQGSWCWRAECGSQVHPGSSEGQTCSSAVSKSGAVIISFQSILMRPLVITPAMESDRLQDFYFFPPKRVTSILLFLYALYAYFFFPPEKSEWFNN